MATHRVESLAAVFVNVDAVCIDIDDVYQHTFEPQSLETLDKQGNACRAPEQADAEFGVRGPHTDMWGFAACVLHLATGQQPYHALTHLQLVSAMLKRKLPEVPNGLPSWLQQALQQCLSFDPAARPSASRLQQVGSHVANGLSLLHEYMRLWVHCL